MAQKLKSENEHCAICGCLLSRKKGTYATATLQGRSHATRHHFVAERFFGRSGNRKGIDRSRLFDECPWGLEGEHEVFCYECHEILLHNPVFTRKNIADFAALVKERNIDEPEKTEKFEKLARRIQLLQEVIEQGISILKNKADEPRKS